MEQTLRKAQDNMSVLTLATTRSCDCRLKSCFMEVQRCLMSEWWRLRNPGRVAFIRKAIATGETGDRLSLSGRLASLGRRVKGSLFWLLAVRPKFLVTSSRKLFSESRLLLPLWANKLIKNQGPASPKRKWTGFLFVCDSQSCLAQPCRAVKPNNLVLRSLRSEEWVCGGAHPPQLGVGLRTPS